MAARDGSGREVHVVDKVELPAIVDRMMARDRARSLQPLRPGPNDAGEARSVDDPGAYSQNSFCGSARSDSASLSVAVTSSHEERLAVEHEHIRTWLTATRS